MSEIFALLVVKYDGVGSTHRGHVPALRPRVTPQTLVKPRPVPIFNVQLVLGCREYSSVEVCVWRGGGGKKGV